MQQDLSSSSQDFEIEQIGRDIQCPVCYNGYNEEDHKACAFGKCSHKICRKCVETIKSPSYTYKCPLCSRVSNDYSIDHTFKKMVDFVRNQLETNSKRSSIDSTATSINSESKPSSLLEEFEKKTFVIPKCTEHASDAVMLCSEHQVLYCPHCLVIKDRESQQENSISGTGICSRFCQNLEVATVFLADIKERFRTCKHVMTSLANKLASVFFVSESILIAVDNLCANWTIREQSSLTQAIQNSYVKWEMLRSTSMNEVLQRLFDMLYDIIKHQNLMVLQTLLDNNPHHGALSSVLPTEYEKFYDETPKRLELCVLAYFTDVVEHDSENGLESRALISRDQFKKRFAGILEALTHLVLKADLEAEGLDYDISSEQQMMTILSQEENIKIIERQLKELLPLIEKLNYKFLADAYITFGQKNTSMVNEQMKKVLNTFNYFERFIEFCTDFYPRIDTDLPEIPKEIDFQLCLSIFLPGWGLSDKSDKVLDIIIMQFAKLIETIYKMIQSSSGGKLASEAAVQSILKLSGSFTCSSSQALQKKLQYLPLQSSYMPVLLMMKSMLPGSILRRFIEKMYSEQHVHASIVIETMLSDDVSLIVSHITGLQKSYTKELYHACNMIDKNHTIKIYAKSDVNNSNLNQSSLDRFFKAFSNFLTHPRTSLASRLNLTLVDTADKKDTFHIFSFIVQALINLKNWRMVERVCKLEINYLRIHHRQEVPMDSPYLEQINTLLVHFILRLQSLSTLIVHSETKELSLISHYMKAFTSLKKLNILRLANKTSVTQLISNTTNKTPVIWTLPELGEIKKTIDNPSCFRLSDYNTLCNVDSSAPLIQLRLCQISLVTSYSNQLNQDHIQNLFKITRATTQEFSLVSSPPSSSSSSSSSSSPSSRIVLSKKSGTYSESYLPMVQAWIATNNSVLQGSDEGQKIKSLKISDDSQDLSIHHFRFVYMFILKSQNIDPPKKLLDCPDYKSFIREAYLFEHSKTSSKTFIMLDDDHHSLKFSQMQERLKIMFAIIRSKCGLFVSELKQMIASFSSEKTCNLTHKESVLMDCSLMIKMSANHEICIFNLLPVFSLLMKQGLSLEQTTFCIHLNFDPTLAILLILSVMPTFASLRIYCKSQDLVFKTLDQAVIKALSTSPTTTTNSAGLITTTKSMWCEKPTGEAPKPHSTMMHTLSDMQLDMLEKEEESNLLLTQYLDSDFFNISNENSQGTISYEQTNRREDDMSTGSGFTPSQSSISVFPNGTNSIKNFVGKPSGHPKNVSCYGFGLTEGLFGKYKVCKMVDDTQGTNYICITPK